MQSAIVRTRSRAALGLVTLLLLATGAMAEGPQDAPEVGVSAQPTDVEPVLAPPAPPDLLLRPRASFPEAQFLSPVGPDHRGSYFTNAGAPGASELTSHEETKLAMARAACGAAELAGTRAVVPPSTTVFAPEDIEAIKQQALEAVRSQQTAPELPIGSHGIGEPSTLMGPIESPDDSRARSARPRPEATDTTQPETDDTRSDDNGEAR